MKIVLLSILIQSSLAIDVATYGACMNATLHATNPEPGTLPGYHCHFSSADCVEGEDWLTPAAVVGMGLMCTCDDDYNSNVFTTACYNMRTHQVGCAADVGSCGEGDYIMGPRYQSHHNVSEDCGDGSSAYGAFSADGSCGKQCRCNFEYRSREDAVEAGSTTYGKCYNPDTNIQYCAANEGTCSGSEEYRGPHSTAFTGPECGCDRAHTGACVTVTSPGEFAFENCAVAADSCESGKSFLSATALKTSGLSRDCRLCANTWDEATVSPAPTDAVTPPPTATPTVSVSPTVSMAPTDTPTTSEPTPAPSAAATTDPTASPTTSPTTASPTASPSASPTAAPVTPKAACKDNQKYRFKKNKNRSCTWIGANEKRRKTQCKKKGVRFNCKITCGTCCADDLTRTFKAGPKGDKQKRDCSYLLVDSRKKSQCPRKVVASACAHTCGRCCKNTPNFTFMDGNTSRECKDIKKSKLMKKTFCSDSNVSENCAAACESCEDFTIKPAPITKPPVKAPVPAPTPVSAPLDDD